MFKLSIHLESPLASGSGLSRPGVVDREVVFDEYGLPWLPGKRIKGLLRDSWSEVRNETSSLATLPEVDHLFGSGGQKEPGSLSVRNAYLRDYPVLCKWARGFVSGVPGRRAAIMRAFSAIRRQTAMDRYAGHPKQDTLRSTRTLHAGLTFEAEIDFVSGSEQEAWAIALAAAALRHMGSSRWRGLGQVKCELISPAEKPVNWTELALDRLTAATFQTKAPVGSGFGDTVASGTSRHHTGEQYGSVLEYELLLKDPAVFPLIEADPNTVSTAAYVPGSAIHGWFAHRFGTTDSDDFRHLFTSGAVRFLNAYPVINSSRAQAVPHSVRQKKDSQESHIDLTCRDAKDIRRVRGWCDARKLEKGNLEKTEPETAIHYHHARAEGDLFQRPLGEQARNFNIAREKAGAFFQFESLSGEQRFVGQIRGQAEDLARIRDLAPEGAKLELGRSRRAQYGGRAELSWRKPSLPMSKEVDGPIQEFRIIARSAVLSHNECGLPVPRFPLEELENELHGKLIPVKEFASTTWESGYLGHLLFQRPQLPAWAAGSVLLVKTDPPIDPNDLKRAAARSYGLRRELGYGEVDMIPGLAPGDINLLADASEPEKPSKPEGAAIGLARLLFTAEVRKEARLTARTVEAIMSGQMPSPSLLHRLSVILAAQSESDFRDSLRSLRARAKRQVESCRVKKGPYLPSVTPTASYFTLTELLAYNRSDLNAWFTNEIWKNRQPWRAVFDQPPEAGRENAVLFLSELLALMARRARQSKEN